MPARPRNDIPRIKAALRNLYWNPIRPQDSGEPHLPSVLYIKRLLEKPFYERKGAELDYADVLRDKQGKIGRPLLTKICSEVDAEFSAGKMMIDRGFLKTHKVPLMDDKEIWGETLPSSDGDLTISPEDIEIILLNSICLSIFEHNLPVISYTLARDLRESLLQLDPGSKLLLLMEFAMRQGMVRASEKEKNEDRKKIILKWADTRDLLFLISMGNWNRRVNEAPGDAGLMRQAPMDFMRKHDPSVPDINTRWSVIYLEPLCLPGNQEIRRAFSYNMMGVNSEMTQIWTWQKWIEHLNTQKESLIERFRHDKSNVILGSAILKNQARTRPPEREEQILASVGVVGLSPAEQRKQEQENDNGS